MKTIIALILLLLTFPMHASSVDCTYSALWGANGEKWDPRGRLPDFSYAGYHAGESDWPTPKPKWDLKQDFHAVGDGKTDDTDALQKALNTITSGVLFIPKGTYVLSKRIDINKGNVIIRGAGPNQTILSFTKSLEDLFGNTPNNNQQSQWSFGPGLINVNGNDPINNQTRIATVLAPAKRGDTTLVLSDSISTQKGEWIRLVESDPPKSQPDTGSLVKYLYGELMPAGDDLLGTPSVVRFLSRVKRVNGKTIELERPLPYDVRLEWKPEIHRFKPTLTEFGIEHLSIHFPWSAYPGHFKEKGYNALFLHDLAQCWVDDLEIQNADFGVDLNATNFCTVKNVTLTTSASRAVGPGARDGNGHHGIDVSHGSENLVTNFSIETKMVHDISVEWYALHTVFSNGRGIDLNMDHHREANYSSLFSNLDCGAGTRPFNSGGSGNRGAHSGAYSTYWNIKAAAPLKLPPNDFGPLLNFVGLNLKDPSLSSTYQWLIEATGVNGVCPADLQNAMKAKRLRK
ncbi:MAG TPA: glycosyl hydrolase family 28-related protein [Pyrinomonadaceae bacterium]